MDESFYAPRFKSLKQLEEAFNKIVKYTKEIEIGETTLTDKDINRLTGENLLNNKVIMAYLELVRNYSIQIKKKVKILSTYFYSDTVLKSKFGDKCLEDIELENLDFIIIPIHLTNHWTLCVIDVKNSTFEYFDSLFSFPTTEILEKIKNHFVNYAENFSSFLNFKLIDRSAELTERQNNGFDCGVYCILYARHRIEQENIKITQNASETLRMKVLHELSMQRLLYPVNFLVK